jgi:subtilisin family serine protease
MILAIPNYGDSTTQVKLGEHPMQTSMPPKRGIFETGNPDTVIGVLDTGVDYNHPDLVDNIWTNPGEIAGDGIDNDSNGYIDDVRGWDFAYNDNDPMDVNGHGTHVSGTIAAKGNNSVGVTGVAWNAKIMPLKFLDDSGSGNISDAILALNYATAKGVKLTNNSWGGGGYSQGLYDAINTAGQQGALFIAAAGNSG